MNRKGLPDGVPLGQAGRLQIKTLEIALPASVTVEKGGIMPGSFSHHVRVVMMAQEKAILIPCDGPFLASLARQCYKAAGIDLPQDLKDEGNK